MYLERVWSTRCFLSRVGLLSVRVDGGERHNCGRYEKLPASHWSKCRTTIRPASTRSQTNHDAKYETKNLLSNTLKVRRFTICLLRETFLKIKKMPDLNFNSKALAEYLQLQNHSDMEPLDMKRKRLDIFWGEIAL